ncbi:MAG: hypothetical protein AAB913_01280 [Patescibacteria group bacterium]
MDQPPKINNIEEERKKLNEELRAIEESTRRAEENIRREEETIKQATEALSVLDKKDTKKGEMEGWTEEEEIAHAIYWSTDKNKSVETKKLTDEEKKEPSMKISPEEKQKPDEKIEKSEKKFDTQKIAEEINRRITEEEAKRDTPFSPEQKNAFALGIFLKAKEDFQKETIESSGKFKRAFVKTEKWWSEDLEKTKWGKISKVVMSTALVGSATLLGASELGIVPAGSIVTKLLSRVAIATGINMAVTSNIPGKFLNIFKKENTGEQKPENTEEENKWKKHLTMQNKMMALGIGVTIGSAFIFSGGLAVAAIGTGGIVARRAFNAYFDKKIKEKEEGLKKLLEDIKTGEPNETFDINALVGKLETFGQEYDNLSKSLNKTKWGKELSNGALTMGSGIATMAVFHHNAEIKAETNHEAQIKHDTDLKHQEEVKHEAELKQQEELKAKIAEQFKIKDATIHKGEGIEHAFIRQIEHNPELAQKLGFNGKPEELHAFAQHEAHIVAIKEGYVDNTGNEVRVAEADKVAYEIKIENGHIVVDEKTIVDGKVEISETHHEGDKFEEQTDKYERVYTKPHVDNIDHILETKGTDISHVETNTGEQIKNEHVDTSKNITPSGIKTAEIATAPIIVESSTNPFKLSEEVLTQVKETHSNNINNLIHANSLSDLDKENLTDTIKEGNASVLMGEDTKEIYHPLQNYMHKLQDLTHLKPIEENPLHRAETPEEYMNRAEMKAAEMGKLDDVKLSDIILNTKVFPNEQVHMQDVASKNLDQIFPKDVTSNWLQKGGLSASQVIGLEKPGQLAGLNAYLHKLEEVTGLKPEEGTATKPSETVHHYVNRALAEAGRQGKLEEIRIHDKDLVTPEHRPFQIPREEHKEIPVEKHEQEIKNEEPKATPENKPEIEKHENTDKILEKRSDDLSKTIKENEIREKALLKEIENKKAEITKKLDDTTRVRKQMEDLKKENENTLKKIEKSEKEIMEKSGEKIDTGKTKQINDNIKNHETKIKSNSDAIEDTKGKMKDLTKKIAEEKEVFKKKMSEIDDRIKMRIERTENISKISEKISEVETKVGHSISTEEKREIAKKMFPNMKEFQ